VFQSWGEATAGRAAVIFGPTSTNEPWPPFPFISSYNQTAYVDTFPRYQNVRWYRDSDRDLSRALDKSQRLVETVLERKRRISREQKMEATFRLRRFGQPELPEALFDKPTFVKRACGGRWRVMAP